MVKKSLWVATLAALVLVAGCSSQKEPATQAVADAEASLAQVKADGSRYAKAKLDAAEAKLVDLKDKLAKKDYKAVVAGAPELQKQVTEVKEESAAARSRHEEATAAATQTWNGLAAEVPGYVQTLEKRVETLVKQRKVQKGPTEESLLLDNVKNLWADASNLFTSGKAVEAVARAEEAKAKASELAAKLKVKL